MFSCQIINSEIICRLKNVLNEIKQSINKQYVLFETWTGGLTNYKKILSGDRNSGLNSTV